MAGPTQAHEAAIGVIEIIEAIEEANASVNERLAAAVNQINVSRSERVEAVADREGVERLGRIACRNRDRERRARHQRWSGAVNRANVGRSLILRQRQVHSGHAGIHQQAPAGSRHCAIDRNTSGRCGPACAARDRTELNVSEIPLRVGRRQPNVHSSPGHDIAASNVLPLGGSVVEIPDIQKWILAKPALSRLIAPAAKSDPQHRNPAWCLVWAAPPRALCARDSRDREDCNGRSDDPRSVATRNGHRRDDPSTDHDAPGAGIGEFARSKRLQVGNVRDLVCRDDDAGRPGVHDGAVTAPTKGDAQPGQGSDVLPRAGWIYVGQVNSSVVFLVSARRPGRGRRDAQQQDDRGRQGDRNCRARSQCRSQCQYGG